jgi:hypothetical protein
LADLLRVSLKVLLYTVACQARLIEKCPRQNTHMVLCVNRIPPEQKKWFPKVLCVFRIQLEQKPDSLLSGKFASLRNSKYRWSNSLRNTLLQRALEFRKSSLSLLRCPAEQPLLYSRGLLPPRWSKLLCGVSSS